MKKYKTLIFDMDDTLVVTKSPLSPEMAELFAKASQKVNMVIITGGLLKQIKTQCIDLLNEDARLENIYILPTSGGEMHRYNLETKEWECVYDNRLTDEQKNRIINSFKNALSQASFEIKPEEIKGEQIEDRESQITMSAIGQYQLPELKYKWDPDQKKRRELVSYMSELKEEFDVNVGGTTSIDITLKGIDKEYGINRFFKETGFDMKEALFIGDKIMPGGNDWPAIKTGIDTYQTHNPENTALIIKEVIVSDHNNMVL